MIITKYIPYLISHRERESVNHSWGKPDYLSNQAASVLPMNHRARIPCQWAKTKRSQKLGNAGFYPVPTGSVKNLWWRHVHTLCLKMLLPVCYIGTYGKLIYSWNKFLISFRLDKGKIISEVSVTREQSELQNGRSIR